MSEPFLILLIVLGTTVLVMGAFALVRTVIHSRRSELPPLDDEGPSGLVLPELPQARTPRERLDQLFDRLILDTGMRIDSAQAIAIMALGGVIGAGIPLLFRDDLILAAAGLIVGVLVPYAFFTIQRARYRRRIQDQLPDAVFLIARSLRAGQNLEQSMATVARYGTQPLAREFRWVVEQTDLGLNVSVALQGMARRLGVTDFNIFVTAVSLYRNLGGNLAMLLERVATSIRDRNQFRGYFRAATALGRITGFVIALAPLVILAAYSIWQPEFVQRLTSTAPGIRALTVAVLLEIIGVIWLYLILRIDY